MRHDHVILRISLPVQLALLATVLSAQAGLPDWPILARKFEVVAQMFSVVERDGYVFDLRSQQLVTVRTIFRLAAIPIVRPSGVTLTNEQSFATPQPTAGIVTSLIDSRSGALLPSEALIVYATLRGADTLYFRGEVPATRDVKLDGNLNLKDGTITIKRDEMLLKKASEGLSFDQRCYEVAFNGRVTKCAIFDLACRLNAAIYADDQCRSAASLK